MQLTAQALFQVRDVDPSYKKTLIMPLKLMAQFCCDVKTNRGYQRRNLYIIPRNIFSS